MRQAKVALDTPGPSADWAEFFTEGEMDGSVAIIARDLGDWDRAESLARRSIMDPGMQMPRQRAAHQLILIEILARRGDYPGATEVIDEVLPVLAPLSSNRVNGRVHDVLAAIPDTMPLDGRRASLAAVVAA